MIDLAEGVVNNDAGAAFSLGNDAQRGEAKPWEMLDKPEGEDRPVAACHKVRHLLPEEGGVEGGRAVAAALKECLAGGEGPRNGGGDGWDAMCLDVGKEFGGGVRNGVYLWVQVVATAV